ncbi:MAG: DUF4919 domain-containing protein [Bacteroidetes bacterium]|nr:DUF4919 domain-containing protein [Bacteroidota bacterium]
MTVELRCILIPAIASALVCNQQSIKTNNYENESLFFNTLLTITLFTIGNNVFGQNFNYHKEFKDILKKSMDKSNSYHFSKLLERFNKNDPSLSNKEIIALQIGFTADKNYKPYKTIDKERAIQKLISVRNTQKPLNNVMSYSKQIP